MGRTGAQGLEETTISGRGGDIGHCQIFQRLWAPPGDGELLQIPGMGYLGGIQQLAGSDEGIVPVKGSLEEDDVYPQ